jgi:hypothetical protein
MSISPITGLNPAGTVELWMQKNGIRRDLIMDSFTETVSAELFSRFPEWSQWSRLEKDEAGRTYLRVDVPALPEAEAISGLIVSTAEDEVTVQFDYYHAHYAFLFPPSESDEAEDAALSLIGQLLSEEVAVVSWWQGDQWRGSSLATAGEAPDNTEFVGSFNRVRMRSWRGTLNADNTV